MTGEEFLNKVRAIKTITDINWHVTGDVLDPDLIKISVIADGEKIEVIYPNPQNSHCFNQNVAVALLINKLMEQMGDSHRVGAADNLSTAVNYLRKLIRTN